MLMILYSVSCEEHGFGSFSILFLFMIHVYPRAGVDNCFLSIFLFFIDISMTPPRFCESHEEYSCYKRVAIREYIHNGVYIVLNYCPMNFDRY
jgi:hypothetical protein